MVHETLWQTSEPNLTSRSLTCLPLAVNRKTCISHLSQLSHRGCLIDYVSVGCKLNLITDIFKCKICDGLQGFYQIYTDASKTNNGTAAAVAAAIEVQCGQELAND